jgi:hypothetical protein
MKQPDFSKIAKRVKMPILRQCRDLHYARNKGKAPAQDRNKDIQAQGPMNFIWRPVHA